MIGERVDPAGCQVAAIQGRMRTLLSKELHKAIAELGVWFKNGQEHRAALYAAINPGAVIGADAHRPGTVPVHPDRPHVSE